MNDGTVTGLGHPLDVLLAPRSIAIVGASANPGKAGAKVLRTLTVTRYGGVIYPVSASQSRIGERVCYPSLEAIGAPVDLAAICLPAEQVPEVLKACGRAGVRSAIVYAEGFFTPESRRELDEALADARARSGLRLLGPNTVGIRNSASWSYVTFSWRRNDRLPGGTVATITQSGGMGTVFGKAMLRRRGLAPRYVIDTGNEVDVVAAECIEYVAHDPGVSCIAVVIEGCRDGDRLVQAVRAARALSKPVVFLKSGRSQVAMAQVASHTGALAGRAEVFDAAMREAGACVVQDEGELTDAIVLHANGRVPKGRGLGVVTPSGGYGILTADAAARYGMDLPQPEVAMPEADRAYFPGAKITNPFDMSAGIGAGMERWTAVLRWMSSQPGVDAILMWQATIQEDAGEQERLYPVLEAAARTIPQPILVCGLTTPDFEERLRRIGILYFSEPTRLVKALSLVAPPAAVVRDIAPPAAHAHAPRRVITGARARELLAGVPHVPTVTVASVEECRRAIASFGVPKAILKVESERIAHKTESGLVSEPVVAADVEHAFAAMSAARARSTDPAAPIVIQPFVTGVELALGGYVDPVFGPVVMVALGGIFLEITRDTAFARAPVTEAAALELILRLKAADVLRGARGRPRADVDAAARALAAFSRFFADNAQRYAEADVNPLIVRAAGDGVVAVDALLVERDE